MPPRSSVSSMRCRRTKTLDASWLPSCSYVDWSAMPRLVPPVLPEGTLKGRPQPVIDGARGVSLRPWDASDATVLAAAYAVPDIRQWHHRSMTEDEAAEYIRAATERWEAARGGDCPSSMTTRWSDAPVCGVRWRRARERSPTGRFRRPAAPASRRAPLTPSRPGPWTRSGSGVSRSDTRPPIRRRAAWQRQEGSRTKPTCVARCCTSTGGTTCTCTPGSENRTRRHRCRRSASRSTSRIRARRASEAAGLRPACDGCDLRSW